MIVDCADNLELARELVAYLKEKKIEAYIQEGVVMTPKELKLENLEMFLKHSQRHRHKAQLIDKMKFLLSIPKNLEDLGLTSCEFCGYLGHPEAVDVHRRSHQAL